MAMKMEWNIPRNGVVWAAKYSSSGVRRFSTLGMGLGFTFDPNNNNFNDGQGSPGPKVMAAGGQVSVATCTASCSAVVVTSRTRHGRVSSAPSSHRSASECESNQRRRGASAAVSSPRTGTGNFQRQPCLHEHHHHQQHPTLHRTNSTPSWIKTCPKHCHSTKQGWAPFQRHHSDITGLSSPKDKTKAITAAPATTNTSRCCPLHGTKAGNEKSQNYSWASKSLSAQQPPVRQSAWGRLASRYVRSSPTTVSAAAAVAAANRMAEEERAEDELAERRMLEVEGEEEEKNKERQEVRTWGEMIEQTPHASFVSSLASSDHHHDDVIANPGHDGKDDATAASGEKEEEEVAGILPERGQPPLFHPSPVIATTTGTACTPSLIHSVSSLSSSTRSMSAFRAVEPSSTSSSASSGVAKRAGSSPSRQTAKSATTTTEARTDSSAAGRARKASTLANASSVNESADTTTPKAEDVHKSTQNSSERSSQRNQHHHNHHHLRHHHQDCHPRDGKGSTKNAVTPGGGEGRGGEPEAVVRQQAGDSWGLVSGTPLLAGPGRASSPSKRDPLSESPPVFASELWYQKGSKFIAKQRFAAVSGGTKRLSPAGLDDSEYSNDPDYIVQRLARPTASSRNRQVTQLPDSSPGSLENHLNSRATRIVSEAKLREQQKQKQLHRCQRFHGQQIVTAEEMREIVGRLSACDPTVVPESGRSSLRGKGVSGRRVGHASLEAVAGAGTGALIEAVGESEFSRPPSTHAISRSKPRDKVEGRERKSL